MRGLGPGIIALLSGFYPKLPPCCVLGEASVAPLVREGSQVDRHWANIKSQDALLGGRGGNGILLLRVQDKRSVAI